MKLKNSTDWPDWFIRRMVSWCAGLVGLPVLKIRQAQFTTTRNRYRGRAWESMRFLVRIAKDNTGFPTQEHKYRSGIAPGYSDRIEALVGVTTHELMHLAQWNDGARRAFDRCEMSTCHYEHVALKAFREARESLLAGWSAEPSYASRPEMSVIEKRAKKAASDLKRWQRKFKLAETKVKVLKARVAYYERSQS